MALPGHQARSTILDLMFHAACVLTSRVFSVMPVVTDGPAMLICRSHRCFFDFLRMHIARSEREQRVLFTLGG